MTKPDAVTRTIRRAQLAAEQANLNRTDAAVQVATAIRQHYQLVPLPADTVVDPQRKG